MPCSRAAHMLHAHGHRATGLTLKRQQPCRTGKGDNGVCRRWAHPAAGASCGAWQDHPAAPGDQPEGVAQGPQVLPPDSVHICVPAFPGDGTGRTPLGWPPRPRHPCLHLSAAAQGLSLQDGTCLESHRRGPLHLAVRCTASSTASHIDALLQMSQRGERRSVRGQERQRGRCGFPVPPRQRDPPSNRCPLPNSELCFSAGSLAQGVDPWLLFGASQNRTPTFV